MKEKVTLKFKKIPAFVFLLITPFFVFAQTNITPNTSATTLAQTIVGSGVTVSGAHFNKCGGVPTGSVVSAGTFTSVSGDLGVGMTSGVVLTTGYATDAFHVGIAPAARQAWTAVDQYAFQSPPGNHTRSSGML